MLIWLPTVGCQASAPHVEPDTIVAVLMTLLEDPSPDTRRTAALSLGKVASPDSSAALIRALQDPDALVRQYTAWALGNLGEQASQEISIPLVPLLRDVSPTVAMAAAEAIGKIGGSERIVKLVTDTVRDPQVHTRRAAVKALFWLEVPSTHDVLVQALQDPDAPVRQGAIAALGELGHVRAVGVMQDRLRHDDDAGVRSEAAYRLGKLGSQTVVPVLRAAEAGDTEGNVRRWARWANEQWAPLDEPGSRTLQDQ